MSRETVNRLLCHAQLELTRYDASALDEARMWIVRALAEVESLRQSREPARDVVHALMSGEG